MTERSIAVSGLSVSSRRNIRPNTRSRGEAAMAVYQFSALSDGQAITFNPDADVLSFDQIGIAAADIRTTIEGSNLRVSVVSGTQAGKDLLLQNVSPLQLATTNVIFADGSRLLVGDDSTSQLADNAANTLTGSTGADHLSGFGGDDSLAGKSGNDLIFGGDGNDTLDGGIGADTLIGNAGDDVYLVDQTGDVVIELAGEGHDTVVATASSYTLADNVEDLYFAGTGAFSGTGNSLDNRLVGGSGIDTLAGGAGDDVYEVQQSADVVIEGLNQGHDAVLSSAASYTLADNVEDLYFYGTGNFSGVGNALANHLAGGSGIDTLAGGAGDDVYEVRQSGDMVIEGLNQGHDAVASWAASYTLADNVEDLYFYGTGNFSGVGNALANHLAGGS